MILVPSRRNTGNASPRPSKSLPNSPPLLVLYSISVPLSRISRQTKIPPAPLTSVLNQTKTPLLGSRGGVGGGVPLFAAQRQQITAKPCISSAPARHIINAKRCISSAGRAVSHHAKGVHLRPNSNAPRVVNVSSSPRSIPRLIYCKNASSLS